MSSRCYDHASFIEPVIRCVQIVYFFYELRRDGIIGHVLMKKGEGVYNVVVIGAGTAGLVTAAGTAGLGGRVALVERNLMGGDCLKFGCVPSKALISSARLIQQIRESEKWGLDRQSPQFVFEKVFERMRSRRAKIAPNGSDKILGSTIVAPHAGDLLHEFVLAMKARIGLGTIASTIHAYPTFAELSRKAGDKYNRTRLTPTAKKFFTWLYERARK